LKHNDYQNGCNPSIAQKPAHCFYFTSYAPESNRERHPAISLWTANNCYGTTDV
jgi:hypothetical protein